MKVIEPSRASFRFYAELNEHLPPEQQYKTLEKAFFTPTTAKDMIESFGVPHTEVDLIVVSSQSVDFSYRVQNGDRIAVYPTFESFDVATEQTLRPQPLRNSTFVLDVHLGRLAAYLRMLGFDAKYGHSLTDAQLAQISASEHRILLTRDRGLREYGAITHGYRLRETDSRRQVREVIHRFQLARAIRPFTRCMVCNGDVQLISKEQVRNLVPDGSSERYNEFQRCQRCGHLYRRRSHYTRTIRWIEELASTAQSY
jgi:uncharacterized protein with PIN domain